MDHFVPMVGGTRTYEAFAMATSRATLQRRAGSECRVELSEIVDENGRNEEEKILERKCVPRATRRLLALDLRVCGSTQMDPHSVDRF